MPSSDVHGSFRDGRSLDESAAETIAETMRALATASRVRLLYALRDGERSVNSLAEATRTTPAAASQQLRVLRHLKLVVARREHQSMLYRLHDEHVARLLDEVRNHAEHAARGWSQQPASSNDEARL
ncbi:MAG: ArsR/SmtB family transcription factor [Solirubrobacteraceae bacterium]